MFYVLTQSYSVYFGKDKQLLPMAPVPGETAIEKCDSLEEACRSMGNRFANYILHPIPGDRRWEVKSRKTMDLADGTLVDYKWIFQEPEPHPVDDGSCYVALRRVFTIVQDI